MKQKTSKKIAWGLAAALCASALLPATCFAMQSKAEKSPFKGVYGGTYTAFAETPEVDLPAVSFPAAEEAPAATYTMQTKGMYSIYKDYLLLATNIEDVKAGYTEVGYKVSADGGAEEKYSDTTYYTGITFKTDGEGGTRTDTMEEIFPENVVTGMIVTEIEYDFDSEYTITPYAVTVDGTEEEGKTFTVEATPAVKQVFEAEGAELVVKNPKWNVKWGGETNQEDVENGRGYGCSGTGFLTGWKSNSSGSQVVFSLTSDRAAEATLSLRMGQRIKYDIWIWRESGNKMFSSLTLNGEPVALPNDYFPKEPAGPDYFAWMEKDIVTLDLQAGENTFVFTTDSDEMNWDYMALTTSAQVSWTAEAENGHEFTAWMVDTMPGQDSEGKMFRYCDCGTREEVTLPALSEEGAYETRTLREADEYLNGLTEYTYHAADGDKVFTAESAPATGAVKDNKIEGEAATLPTPEGTGFDAGILVNSASSADNWDSPFLQFNNRKGKMSWTVEVSDAATVTLVLGAAGYQSKHVYVNDVLGLTVDGRRTAMQDAVVASGESTDGTWWEFNDYVVATFDLTAGEHVIALEASGGNSYNLDYILLRSVADITLKAA